MKSRVSIVFEEDISRALPGALERLEDLSDLFRGRHVAIKPNDTWASHTDTSACTRADTVQAMIRYVKRFAPKKITVSGGAGAAETEDVFRYLGIDRVMREENVEFFDHNRGPFVRVRLSYGPQKEVMVNPYVREYDTLVSLAQHKVHESATVTLTMKNIAMSYPAADYYGHPRLRQTHPHHFFDDLQSFIAGMCQKFPIDLGIITGHPAMTERGPIGGETFESGITLASRDCVAADFIGAKILGLETVEHIQKAGALNLGAASMEEIEIVGISLEQAIRIFNERAMTQKERLAYW